MIYFLMFTVVLFCAASLLMKAYSEHNQKKLIAVKASRSSSRINRRRIR